MDIFFYIIWPILLFSLGYWTGVATGDKVNPRSRMIRGAELIKYLKVPKH